MLIAVVLILFVGGVVGISLEFYYKERKEALGVVFGGHDRGAPPFKFAALHHDCRLEAAEMPVKGCAAHPLASIRLPDPACIIG